MASLTAEYIHRNGGKMLCGFKIILCHEAEGCFKYVIYVLFVYLQFTTDWMDNRITFIQLQEDWQRNPIYEDIWQPRFHIQPIAFSEYLEYSLGTNAMTCINAIKGSADRLINFQSRESKYCQLGFFSINRYTAHTVIYAYINIHYIVSFKL